MIRPAIGFVLSFSTATSPTQIYTVEAKDRQTIVMHTEEKHPGHSAGLPLAGRRCLIYLL